jgi:HTH-type transcriptional regulator/antitoxin HigA
MFDICPIRTETDHAAALAEIERLWPSAHGTPEADRLEALAALVGLYEDRVHPIDPPDPVEAIRFHLDQGRLTRADLARILGSRARVSEILARRRPLTLGMVWRLHTEHGIPLESLARPYETQPYRQRAAVA